MSERPETGNTKENKKASDIANAWHKGIDWFDDIAYTGPRESSHRANPGKVLDARQTQFLSGVQLSLSLELGELRLSAAELIDLFPGQVFPYAFDPLKELEVKIGLETIAFGRLVMCGEEFGIEITRITQTDSSSLGNQRASIDDNSNEESERPRFTQLGEDANE